MSDKYKITDNEKAYFITMTVVGWIVSIAIGITRKEQKLLIIDSLKYCQQNKGLVVFAYCLMPSHLHIICKADDGFSPAGRAGNLSDILRDLKTFTPSSRGLAVRAFID